MVQRYDSGRNITKAQVSDELADAIEDAVDRHDISESKIVREGIRHRLSMLQVEEANDE